MQNATSLRGIPNPISLMLGFPDSASLDTPEFQAAVQRVLASQNLAQSLQYGDEQGNPTLIHYLVEKIRREQNIPVEQNQVMVTAGSTHAIDMIARLYAKHGGGVIVEAPTYADALHIFRDHHIQLHSVPIDENGMVVEALEELLERLSATQNLPTLLYTVPNFHNPTGVTLSEERRIKIVQLARQYNIMIVEDDVYRDLTFDESVPTSFFALADGLNVIQVGSFSKTLAPGLRLGWMLASSEIIERCVYCGTTQMSGGANPFVAQIAAEYCQQGDWDTHVQNLRELYQTRRDTMLSALKQYMPADVTWTHPKGGFFVWVTLPEKVMGKIVKAQALEQGVLVASGEGYFINSRHGEHHLRLTYSFASLDDIEKAVHILADIIRE